MRGPPQKLRRDSPPSSGDGKVAPAGGAKGAAPSDQSRPSGYCMLKSFEMTNFRAYRHVRLENLPRVNILVGKSASGKTAILEGMRLALGATPTVAWNLTNSRGLIVSANPNPTREQFESSWLHYFREFDGNKVISFRLTDTDKRDAIIDIYFDKEKPFTPQPSLQPGIGAMTSTIIPVAFKRQNFLGEETTLLATLTQQQGPFATLFLQQGPEIGIASDFFSSTWQSNAIQVAQWLSQLRISTPSADEEIVKAIHKEFSDVLEISPEMPQGVASVYVKMKHHLRKMPIGLISSGINKFVSLLIAIRTYRGGVVLIDEIENGIYYKMFPNFWEALHKFASENDTQLFVSTHSWECLKGTLGIIQKHAKDFGLIQVTQEEGVSTAVLVPGDRAAAAIEADIEVRK